MDKTNSLKNLDGLRGCASIYVLIHHSRWLLTESYSSRLSKGIKIDALDYMISIFRFGHEVVIFFFVLSGFLIHLSTLRSLESSNRISWKVYFIKRVNRIYPPFVLALFFTLTIDIIGSLVFNFSVYNLGSKYFALSLTDKNFSVLAFAGNLLNLQGLISTIPVFGSNGALWSLSYEWWFYLLYPLFFWIHKKNWILAFATQLFLFLIAIIFHLDVPILSEIFQKMLIWWLGVVLAEVTFHKMKALKKYLSMLIVFIPIAVLFFYNDRLFGDLFWGLGFLALINILINTSSTNIVNQLLEKISFSGSFSYTLYLLHLPIAFFFHGYLIDRFGGSLPNSYWFMLAVTVGTAMLSSLISIWVEKIKFIST